MWNGIYNTTKQGNTKYSSLTAQRILNDICHAKDNCIAYSKTCNCSKSRVIHVKKCVKQKFQIMCIYYIIYLNSFVYVRECVKKGIQMPKHLKSQMLEIVHAARHIRGISFAVVASTLDPYPGQNRKVLSYLKHISTPSMSSTSTSFRIFSHIYMSATSRINHLRTKCGRICRTA